MQSSPCTSPLPSPNSFGPSPSASDVSSFSPTDASLRRTSSPIAAPEGSPYPVGLGIDLFAGAESLDAQRSLRVPSPRGRLLGLYAPAQGARDLLGESHNRTPSDGGVQPGTAARALSGLLGGSPTGRLSALALHDSPNRFSYSPPRRPADAEAHALRSPFAARPRGLGQALGLKPFNADAEVSAPRLSLGLRPRGLGEALGMRPDPGAAGQAPRSLVGVRPGGLGEALGMRMAQHSRPAVPSLFDEALLMQARQMLANTQSLPCYAEGEEFRDEDGGRLTILSQMKLREVPIHCLMPLRTDARLSAEKMLSLQEKLLRETKLAPLKISRDNEVMDGNHRFALAQRLGLGYVSVILEEAYPTPRQPAVARWRRG